MAEKTPSRPRKNKRPDDVVNLDNLAGIARVNKRQVQASLVPWSDTTLWRHVRNGSFPEPIRDEYGRCYWQVSDLREWAANGARAAA